METIVCRLCGRNRFINCFYLRDSKRKIYRNECKDCIREKRGQKKKERRRENVPRACTVCGVEKPASEFNFKQIDLNTRQSYCKSCRPYSPRYSRDRKLKTKYGITIEEYEALAKKQEYKCAICCEEKPLQVDHNHANNQIRGLLCGECNRALGLFRDDLNSLKTAYQYIGGSNAAS